MAVSRKAQEVSGDFRRFLCVAKPKAKGGSMALMETVEVVQSIQKIPWCNWIVHGLTPVPPHEIFM